MAGLLAGFASTPVGDLQSVCGLLKFADTSFRRERLSNVCGLLASFGGRCRARPAFRFYQEVCNFEHLLVIAGHFAVDAELAVDDQRGYAGDAVGPCPRQPTAANLVSTLKEVKASSKLSRSTPRHLAQQGSGHRRVGQVQAALVNGPETPEHARRPIRRVPARA